MTHCCPCAGAADGQKAGLPLICLVPRDDARNTQKSGSGPRAPPKSSSSYTSGNDFTLLDDEYIKKNFKLPQRALYLDPFRRPLITFPMNQENSANFNMHRKNKTNQQILDGILDASSSISSPSVFPYGKTEAQKRSETEDDEEVIYILQLPDYEFKCPVHKQTIKTPRFIWHSCKKSKKEPGVMVQGGGPMNKPKPWLLSRLTDFDLLSQW